MVRKMEKPVLFILAFLLLPLFLLGTDDSCQEFLRLHVLANSDSADDQLLKLKAKDAVLSEVNKLLYNEKDLHQVLEILKSNQSSIEEVAKEAIDEKYEVSIELRRESYPHKKYGSLELPKGEYLSLQVIIGKGEGQNWWCVLFPLLCSIEAGENAIEVVDGKEGPPVKFRFKLAENRKEPPSLDSVLAFLQQFRLWPWS